MHEGLKHLIKKSKEIFSMDFINNLSKKSGFTKRKGKLSAEDFMAFSIFSSEDLCIKSLSSLCARLEVQFGIIRGEDEIRVKIGHLILKPLV